MASDNVQVAYFSQVRGKPGFEGIDKQMAAFARAANPDFEFHNKTKHLYGLGDKELVDELQRMGYDAAIFLQGSQQVGTFAFQQKETPGDVGLCFVYVAEELRGRGLRDICARAFVASEKAKGTKRIYTSSGRSDKPPACRLEDEKVARMVSRLGEKSAELGIRVSPKEGLIELV